MRRLLSGLSGSVFVLGAALAGCDDNQEVLDAETPAGQVEMTRDPDTGDLDVDATDKETVLDVDTPGANVEIQRDRDRGDVDVDVNSK